MRAPEILSNEALHSLPPMLFGHIRWNKAVGNPQGDPCSGFRILVEERTASQFRMGSGGHPEVIPGTGVWKVVAGSAPCTPGPSNGEMQEVTFRVPSVHLNAFPDGKYRITPELVGEWHSPVTHVARGFRRVEPVSWHVVLRPDAHIVSVDFEVIWSHSSSQAEWQALHG
jgi:hypothetical protein